MQKTWFVPLLPFLTRCKAANILEKQKLEVKSDRAKYSRVSTLEKTQLSAPRPLNQEQQQTKSIEFQEIQVKAVPYVNILNLRQKKVS
jgi:hypothetical protein